MIRNPVLPGSNPDPSVLRVGDDYYLATSSFQWFPGIRLHHSRDLAHWRLIAHALDRPGQIDLRAVPDSCGIWAPNLTFARGLYFLVYPLVSARGVFPLAAVANCLISAERIEGPWSDPVFLHGSGWDPALFHDDDGRTWLLGMQLDPRPGRPPSRGITIQEYLVAQQRLVGPVRTIFAGTPLGCTEGPQLFGFQGWHYLVTAEGGTSWGHAVTVARARELFGPYLCDPEGPLLTARTAPEHQIQKAGHGSFVQSRGGEWFLAFLATRPLGPRRSSPLGRETFMAKLRWTDDGWPRLAHGTALPPMKLPGPRDGGPVRGKLPATPPAETSSRDDFDVLTLHPEWNTLREPPEPSWCSLALRPGHLSLRGREPLYCPSQVSLVARRLEQMEAVVTTCLAFEPRSVGQAAGLVLYHDSRDAVLACITHDEEVGKCVALIRLEAGRYADYALGGAVAPGQSVVLEARLSAGVIQFYWRPSEGTSEPLGPAIDVSVLADDQGGKDSFTGAFVGMAAQDPFRQCWAAFDWFEHRMAAAATE